MKLPNIKFKYATPDKDAKKVFKNPYSGVEIEVEGEMVAAVEETIALNLEMWSNYPTKSQDHEENIGNFFILKNWIAENNSDIYFTLID